MLKWIGGMQALCLVMGLYVVTILLIVIGTDDIIRQVFVGLTIIVFGVYSVVMAVWVMPMFEKEKKEKRQAVLDKNEKVVKNGIVSVNATYRAIVKNLYVKGLPVKEIDVILYEIHSKTYKEEKINEK